MARVIPRTYIYGICIFTLIVVSGITLIGNFREVNPDFVDDERFEQFNSYFNKTDQLNSSIGTIRDSVKQPGNIGPLGVLNALLNTANSALTSLITSFSFMDAAFSALTLIFGVPDFVVAIAILMIVVMISFSIWSAYFQKEL